MQQIISTLNKISLIPGAQVDRCFLQGREVIVKQLRLRLGDEETGELTLDSMIEVAHEAFEDVQKWVQPYQLPDSYLLFLAFCGGFAIDTDKYRITAYGIGPMTEEWYGFLMGDHIDINPSKIGFVTIARLTSQIPKNGEYPEVFFFIDLAGVIPKDAVIGVIPLLDEIDPILENPSAYQQNWKLLAPSFTEWLELVADTDGLLGYRFD
jgi:hypothetical protein